MNNILGTNKTPKNLQLTVILPLHQKDHANDCENYTYVPLNTTRELLKSTSQGQINTEY